MIVLVSLNTVLGSLIPEETAQKIDVEIKSIIENQYQRAVQILSENRDKLDALLINC